MKVGHQVLLKNNKISSVLGAYKSWGGKIKVLNTNDRYLEVRSCNAQCVIGATRQQLRGLSTNQRVNIILKRPLKWRGKKCRADAKSIRRL